MKKTKVLVLAAGQGTRLRPITNDIPKCLVPLLGTSLLERQISTLNNAGIDDIHIATGYRKEQLEVFGYGTSYNPRYFETNMVESLFSAMEFIRKEGGDLIIAYGDIVYQQSNLQTLLACDEDIALMIDKGWRDLWSKRLENPLDDAETLVMEPNGYITELGKKPDSYDNIQGQYTGLIKIKSNKIEDLVTFYQQLDRDVTYDGKDFDNMYMTSFLQLLIDSGWKVKAAEVQHGWLEIDSVDDLEHYHEMAKSGELDQFYKVEA
ncbi:NTP transferase domain-containing protein [Vibrio sp. 10N.261.46.E11]|uniref:phosphocholine cytidylyltransferase family protein n=1 Tax=Vibrio sp. 10N.261.46.E11 TaxID=3229662 RepID=UPI0035536BD9